MNEVNLRGIAGEASVTTLVERLHSEDIELVRLSYCDMHGTARGKDIPLEMLGHAVQEGYCILYCEPYRCSGK